MSGPAYVHSVEAIEAVKTVLLGFRENVDHALAMLDVELRRMLDWLEHDCPRYWKGQIHKANEEVARTRAELQRCLMFPIADERPSCLEKRAALKRAEARLAYCEHKLQRVRHWSRELRREQFEYDGRTSKLSRVVEHDVARAAELLTRLVRRLEEYQATTTNRPSESYDGMRLVEELFQTEDDTEVADSQSSDAHDVKESSP